MHIEIRVSKGKPKYQFKKDSNTKDKHFHSLDQGENGSHFYFEKTPNKLWVKRRTCEVVKFIYCEKAKIFCEIFPLLLTTVYTVKSKGEILKILWPSQNI